MPILSDPHSPPPISFPYATLFLPFPTHSQFFLFLPFPPLFFPFPLTLCYALPPSPILIPFGKGGDAHVAPSAISRMELVHVSIYDGIT
jgi:hypothetical protein